jgi:hypothetical protein
MVAIDGNEGDEDLLVVGVYPKPPAPMIEIKLGYQEMPESSGLYFIWGRYHNKCMYVGQSANIKERCRTFRSGSFKEEAGARNDGKLFVGERISWLQMDCGDLFFAEAFYIGLLRPVRNQPPFFLRGSKVSELRKKEDEYFIESQFCSAILGRKESEIENIAFRKGIIPRMHNGVKHWSLTKIL